METGPILRPVDPGRELSNRPSRSLIKGAPCRASTNPLVESLNVNDYLLQAKLGNRPAAFEPLHPPPIASFSGVQKKQGGG